MCNLSPSKINTNFISVGQGHVLGSLVQRLQAGAKVSHPSSKAAWFTCRVLCINWKQSFDRAISLGFTDSSLMTHAVELCLTLMWVMRRQTSDRVFIVRGREQKASGQLAASCPNDVSYSTRDSAADQKEGKQQRNRIQTERFILLSHQRWTPAALLHCIWCKMQETRVQNWEFWIVFLDLFEKIFDFWDWAPPPPKKSESGPSRIYF